MAKTAPPDTSEAAKVRAIIHPLRRQIIRLMLDKPVESTVSPREIARALPQPLHNVSYHVRVLAECGAITLKCEKPVRGTMEHFYSPCPEFVALPWVPVVLDAMDPGSG